MEPSRSFAQRRNVPSCLPAQSTSITGQMDITWRNQSSVALLVTLTTWCHGYENLVFKMLEDNCRNKSMTDLPRQSYWSFTIQVQDQLDDETIFPSKIGVPFPKNFQSIAKTILKVDTKVACNDILFPSPSKHLLLYFKQVQTLSRNLNTFVLSCLNIYSTIR